MKQGKGYGLLKQIKSVRTAIAGRIAPMTVIAAALLAVALIGGAVLLTTQVRAAADSGAVFQSSDAFVINIKAGIDGKLREGCYAPIQVTVTPQGRYKEHWKGKLRIVVSYGSVDETQLVTSENEDTGMVVYEEPIELEPKSNVQAKTVFMPAASGCSIQAQLVEEDDNILQFSTLAQVSPNLGQNDVSIAAWVSDHTYSYGAIEGIILQENPLFIAHYFQMSEHSLPSDVFAWDMIDVFIISPDRLKQLQEEEPEKLSVIRDWVMEGNTIVTAHASSQEGNDLSQNTGLLSGIFGSKAIATDIIDGSYRTYSVGKGTLAVLDGTDMQYLIGQMNEDEQDELISLASKIMDYKKISQKCSTGMEQQLYTKTQTLVTYYGERSQPDVKLYLIVIMIYVLLVIPGSYAVMSKLKKLYYFRVEIVVGAVIFACIIYAMGSQTRFEEPFCFYTQLRQTDENHNQTEKAYVMVQSPYNGEYTMDFDDTYEVLCLDYRSNQSLSPESDAYKVYNSLKGGTSLNLVTNQVTYRNTHSFEQQELLLTKGGQKIQGETLTLDAAYILGDETEDGSKKVLMEGTVVNKTDQCYTDVVVLMYKKYVQLGTIEPGQSVTFTQVVMQDFSTDEAGWEQQLVKQQPYGAAINGTSEQNTKAAMLLEYLEQGDAFEAGKAKVIGYTLNTESFTDEETLSYGITMDIVSSLIDTSKTGDGCYYAVLPAERAVESGSASGDAIFYDEAIIDYDMKKLFMGNKSQQDSSDTFSLNFRDAISAGENRTFTGNISIYNYDTGKFEPIGIVLDGTFTKDYSIGTYLDTSYKMRLMYESDQKEYIEQTLPVIGIRIGG